MRLFQSGHETHASKTHFVSHNPASAHLDGVGSTQPVNPQISASQVLNVDLANSDVQNIASPITIVEGGSAVIDGSESQAIAFTGTTGTLTIEHSQEYTAPIAGLSGADALDLTDISFGPNTAASYLGDPNGGTLTVSDGVHTANIALTGNYLSSYWHLSDDGAGGTLVVDPVAPNNWKELKIGAGGYLTGMDIAPDGTMVVRTDTYGAYRWNGTQWQQLVTSTSMPAIP